MHQGYAHECVFILPVFQQDLLNLQILLILVGEASGGLEHETTTLCEAMLHPDAAPPCEAAKAQGRGKFSRKRKGTLKRDDPETERLAFKQ